MIGASLHETLAPPPRAGLLQRRRCRESVARRGTGPGQRRNCARARQSRALMNPVPRRLSLLFHVKQLLPFCVVLSLLSCRDSARAGDKPNIVYILCDDLGYGDVKCLNPEGKIATPHADRLARGGDDFHRRALELRGLLADALRHSHRPLQLAFPAEERRPRRHESAADRDRPTDCSSIFASARILTPRRSGKWHLGMNWPMKAGRASVQRPYRKRGRRLARDFEKPISQRAEQRWALTTTSASRRRSTWCRIHSSRTTG